MIHMHDIVYIYAAIESWRYYVNWILVESKEEEVIDFVDVFT